MDRILRVEELENFHPEVTLAAESSADGNSKKLVAVCFFSRDHFDMHYKLIVNHEDILRCNSLEEAVNSYNKF